LIETNRNENYRRIGWRLVDFGLIPLLFFLFLHYPDYRHGYLLPWDEGQHLAAISGLFHGKVLYRDIYDISAPLPEIIPYAMMKVSSPDAAVLRSFYYYGTLLSLLVIYLAATRLIKGRTTVLLATLLCANFSIFAYWANRWGGFRIGAAYLAILSLWFYVESRKRSWVFVCGAACAVAFLFSPEMGVITAAIGMGIGVAHETIPRTEARLPKQSILKTCCCSYLDFLLHTVPG